jgi:phospholipid/cholesterol/gamma-HCH transport system substrate-binding protein
MVRNERIKIAAILSDFESVSGNLKQNNDDISKLMTNLNSFSETLVASDVKSTVDNANQSLTKLNNILSNIGEGQGTLGKFAKDDSLYIYLQRSSDDLDKLLIDLRENPKDYVHFSIFGNKKTKSKK